MTDRLRELAEQAGMDIRAYAEHYPAMGAQLFKFATLVRRDALEEAAQECDRVTVLTQRSHLWPHTVGTRSDVSRNCSDRIRALAAQEEA